MSLKIISVYAIINVLSAMASWTRWIGTVAIYTTMMIAMTYMCIGQCAENVESIEKCIIGICIGETPAFLVIIKLKIVNISMMINFYFLKVNFKNRNLIHTGDHIKMIISQLRLHDNHKNRTITQCILIHVKICREKLLFTWCED